MTALSGSRYTKPEEKDTKLVSAQPKPEFHERYSGAWFGHSRPLTRIMRIVSEAEFSGAIRLRLLGVQARAVVGPGRSGAVASVYASHILGIPFIPYGTECPEHLRPLLIVDTARKSGATLRKAERRYGGDCVVVHVFDEPPRLRFWYEPEAHNVEIQRGAKAPPLQCPVGHEEE